MDPATKKAAGGLSPYIVHPREAGQSGITLASGAERPQADKIARQFPADHLHSGWKCSA
jgi:hypothetical protein